MTEDAAARKVEVLIGRRVSAAYGGPAFLGEKVRFSGQPLGHYTDTSTVDDGNLLKREDVAYSLYRCPNGYRVVRRETRYRRRGERSRWHMTEVHTSMLPVIEGENAGQDGEPPVYGIYSEEEARRAFPKLFSAVGLPNVRELD